jgi:protein-disulfide isomerase
VKPLVRLLTVIVALLAAGSAGAAEQSYPIDRVLGQADAPVTIIEYASLTCGHCATFYKTTMPKVKEQWIDTGRAKLIYRDFPTGPKGLSVGAAIVVHCAGPERYFGLLGLLFDQQEKWMNAQSPLAELKKLAKLAGLGEDKVDACLQDQGLAAAIDQRAADAATKYGIDGTPSFVIDGKVLAGAQPYEELDKALKAATKK